MESYRLMPEGYRQAIKLKLHSEFPIIQTVIDGTQQGRLFTDENNHWVLHKAGFSEVFLRNDDVTGLVNFISEDKNVPSYFHFYNPDFRLIDAFQSRPKVFNVRIRERVVLRYTGDRGAFSSIDGIMFSPVTKNNFESLFVFNLDLKSKFWNGEADFINNSLGIVGMNDLHVPISLCYAAAIANKTAEVDIVTLETMRGKGLGKETVIRFIKRCQENDLSPNWDCFSENLASLNIAVKLGFKLEKKYNFLSIFKKV